MLIVAFSRSIDATLGSITVACAADLVSITGVAFLLFFPGESLAKILLTASSITLSMESSLELSCCNRAWTFSATFAVKSSCMPFPADISPTSCFTTFLVGSFSATE